MRKAIYNVDKLDWFNINDKEAGIRNFLRQLEDGFSPNGGDTLTFKGGGITRTLKGFGCIDTPGYHLICSTNRKSIRVIENDKVIYQVFRKNDFSAREAYSSISYGC